LGAIKLQWKEEETFRIDHYLGKEMVKNILVLRFANVALNAAWDKNSISNVQITFKEPFGTEGRGGYFDEFGIIRDILQNHLLQVLSIIAMERPVSFSAEDIRDEKVKVLRAIPPIERKDTFLASMSPQMENRAISTTTQFRATRYVQRLQPRPYGSTTHVGRGSPSF
jgi:glucose-6-phosphate 1-dehydrogenase